MSGCLQWLSTFSSIYIYISMSLFLSVCCLLACCCGVVVVVFWGVECVCVCGYCFFPLYEIFTNSMIVDVSVNFSVTQRAGCSEQTEQTHQLCHRYSCLFFVFFVFFKFFAV